METDLCCAHGEVTWVDKMRGLRSDISVQYVTNNIDTKFYLAHLDSQAQKEGVMYQNSGDMYSSMNTLYEQHNVQMLSLFTVWNEISSSVSSWMEDSHWGDSVARSHGLCHDWPGSYVSWDRSDQAWIDRWSFYQHVHQRVRNYYKKPIMHMFTIGGTNAVREWSQTQEMVREIEDANVVPDVWIVNNFEGPSQQVPESDSTGKPLKTLTGFTYWLLKRIHGDELHESLSMAVGESTPHGANVTLRNLHPWMDILPVLLADGELEGTTVMNDGTRRSGRLWPGDEVTLFLRCGKTPSVTLNAYHHPSSDRSGEAFAQAHVECPSHRLTI